MAYMNQEDKKKLTPQIKKVLKKYGVKGTIAVKHHSTLVVNIKSSNLDFIGNINANRPEHKKELYGEIEDYVQVNTYHIENNYTGECKKFLTELSLAMNGCEEIQNHDNSDMMTDYFDIGWYTDINIGKWDKPYELIRSNNG
tara:strand:- start:1367 stop:1792 length:426 start_codon:yes stop_codon:yes gene_type:complete